MELFVRTAVAHILDQGSSRDLTKGSSKGGDRPQLLRQVAGVQLHSRIDVSDVSQKRTFVRHLSEDVIDLAA
ncbi:MAG: hypothetical protein ACM30D_04645 [Hyphomicrobiales bacterium]